MPAAAYNDSLETGRMPVILYVDCSFVSGIDMRRLDGLRRYAAARKWRVETLEHKDCSPAALREALARLRPIGCAAEWCRSAAFMRPSLFGRVPVVYFEPQGENPGWRDVPGVVSDAAAVAKMAFEELSSTNPSAYAAVSFDNTKRWARERMEAFRECCRKAGADCQTWYFPMIHNDDELRARTEKMVPWAAALPHRCAVFAVNDWCAHCVARAMVSAGRSFPRTVTLVGADGTEALAGEKELAAMVSSVRLDQELAGYLAAKMIGEFAANDAAPLARMTTRALREMTTAACAANDDPPHGRNNNISSLPPKAAPSLLAEPAPSLRAKPALSLVFPPLLVDRRKSTRGYGRREPRILEAVETIRREACDGLTAKALAKRVGFRGTRRLFDMRFREAMGHPPLDEIIHVRMERVLELLAQPDFPISAIADFSGFRSERELQKLFRSRFKMSMRDWRKARQ